MESRYARVVQHYLGGGVYVASELVHARVQCDRVDKLSIFDHVQLVCVRRGCILNEVRLDRHLSFEKLIKIRSVSVAELGIQAGVAIANLALGRMPLFPFLIGYSLWLYVKLLSFRCGFLLYLQTVRSGVETISIILGLSLRYGALFCL